ncbi:unnamed protein product [Ectocarpus sp. 4 AP-2014]
MWDKGWLATLTPSSVVAKARHGIPGQHLMKHQAHYCNGMHIKPSLLSSDQGPIPVSVNHAKGFLIRVSRNLRFGRFGFDGAKK